MGLLKTSFHERNLKFTILIYCGIVLSEEVAVVIEEFARFGLSDENIWPHDCGDILIKYIGRTPDGLMEAMWGLMAGTKYRPERHTHGHLLIIKCGRGNISVNGQVHAYSPGDEFLVSGNVPHGFVRVDETTVVVQRESR